MEDEGILAKYRTADPVGRGRKSCLYHRLEYSVHGRATFCPYRQDQLYVFGAISSSSILRAHLSTTPSSMYISQKRIVQNARQDRCYLNPRVQNIVNPFPRGSKCRRYQGIGLRRPRATTIVEGLYDCMGIPFFRGISIT